MKILWLSHLVPYPPKGGVLQRAYYLLREAAKYHELDLLAFHQPNLMRPLVPSLEEGVEQSKSVLGEFCNEVVIVDIESEKQFLGNYRLALKSLFTNDPFNINWLKSEEFSNSLQQLLASNDYDLVHLDTVSLLPYFKYVNQIPTVLDHHNIESHMLLRRADNENNFLKKWYFRQEGLRLEKFEKNYCPQVSLNITCSEIDKQRLNFISPNSRVEVVPNVVDVDYFDPGDLVSKQRSIVFIGTLSWYPNVEAVRFIANELWPVLKAAIPDIRADIIGSSPPADITQVSEQDADFHVHGYVDDILPFMKRAAVYVCPINDGGGTKLKILDAMSMSMAIVAHPLACEGIAVEVGKNVFFAETADDYVHSIKQLIENEDVLLNMGAEARKLVVSNYSSTQIGKALSKLYEGCRGKK